MTIIGPDFPKCPACGKDMHSITLSEVPNVIIREMLHLNRYRPLNPNRWYKCDDCDIIIHKDAVKTK